MLWRIRATYALARRSEEAAKQIVLSLLLLGTLSTLPPMFLPGPIALIAVVALLALSAEVVRAWSNAAAAQVEASVARAIPAIDTPRLHLRQVEPGDHAAFDALLDDVAIEANGWTPRQRVEMLRAVRTSAVLPVADLWAIVERASGRVIGDVVVSEVDREAGRCQLGWMLGPAHRGKGHGTEAVGAVLDALHRVGFGQVRIGTAVDNVAVQRVTEKVGARLVETTAHVLPNGRTVESRWYVHER